MISLQKYISLFIINDSVVGRWLPSVFSGNVKTATIIIDPDMHPKSIMPETGIYQV